MPTDWEVYLDTALDMYKHLYLDKLKGKIFTEEKKKELAMPTKAAEHKDMSKSGKTSDKGKGLEKPSGTSNNSGSRMMKPSGSSSGSQQSGTKKLDPKKKYKVRVVSCQELMMDDEDESPKATIGMLSVDHPHILERIIPLDPDTCISEEETSKGSPMAERTSSVQVTPAGPVVPAPTPSGNSYRVQLPWLRKRIADSTTVLGIHGGSPKDFLTEHM
ncbi:hypothetical protein WOLCODRAFT_159228 [Wolfiporia cocos MD-104 SS10]|uniref:Uncharacterized protein n=1 Tax=Wolfiporia cocos (strain MD-104) TaxID=742152 RepID=A0A2H3JPI6_WOLCO|nr:hypothetical protein WOLCODRAFT_159228 [Wolfiporia cocos MD-104 SS10]